MTIESIPVTNILEQDDLDAMTLEELQAYRVQIWKDKAADTRSLNSVYKLAHERVVATIAAKKAE